MNQAKSRVSYGLQLKQLLRTGILKMVAVSVVAGYLVGHPPDQSISILNLALCVFGIVILSAGGSAINQWQEVEIDSKMPRTQVRPIPSGTWSKQGALSLGLVLSGIGLFLCFSVSLTVGAMAVIAVIFYNGLYTLWWKRKWAFAAVPGAIPGALPILMGYVAASQGELHPRGFYLFFILLYWQMPHFWSLAIRYKEDYRSGGVPTLPVAKGTEQTVFYIRLWTLGYCGLLLIGHLFIRELSARYFIATSIMAIFAIRESFKFSENHWRRFFIFINFTLVIALLFICTEVWIQHWVDLFV